MTHHHPAKGSTTSVIPEPASPARGGGPRGRCPLVGPKAIGPEARCRSNPNHSRTVIGTVDPFWTRQRPGSAVPVRREHTVRTFAQVRRNDLDVCFVLALMLAASPR